MSIKTEFGASTSELSLLNCDTPRDAAVLRLMSFAAKCTRGSAPGTNSRGYQRVRLKLSSDSSPTS